MSSLINCPRCGAAISKPRKRWTCRSCNYTLPPATVVRAMGAPELPGFDAATSGILASEAQTSDDDDS